MHPLLTRSNGAAGNYLDEGVKPCPDPPFILGVTNTRLPGYIDAYAGKSIPGTGLDATKLRVEIRNCYGIRSKSNT